MMLTINAFDTPVVSYCYIGLSEFYRPSKCWGNCGPGVIVNHFGVFRDYYKKNPQYLPTHQPDGTLNEVPENVKGVCDEISTAFGKVNYREMTGRSFLTADSKNVVRESGSNCAARCFEKAGCSAFYVTDDGCTFIIGYAYGAKVNSEVSEAGKIHTICPNAAFTNTFTRLSRFQCILFAPSESESVVDEIIEQNPPLNAWQYETKSNSPMITSSQYISMEMSPSVGNDRKSRLVTFTIETHVRIGGSSRRKRRSDDDEIIPVGYLTSENYEKLTKKAIKEAAKNASKQRQIMPRTENIIAQIEAIEQQATSFILDGGMQIPDEVEVAATGPIETVEFVQTAADGSVAADCASGSCQCSTGFIDNGNGCEKMTEEQAATTSAPTTTKAPTDQPTEYITSLLEKLESVFEANRPRRPRTHLMKKWGKLERKSISQYNKMKANGCEFPDSFESEDIDFDTVDACNVSL